MFADPWCRCRALAPFGDVGLVEFDEQECLTTDEKWRMLTVMLMASLVSALCST